MDTKTQQSFPHRVTKPVLALEYNGRTILNLLYILLTSNAMHLLQSKSHTQKSFASTENSLVSYEVTAAAVNLRFKKKIRLPNSKVSARSTAARAPSATQTEFCKRKANGLAQQGRTVRYWPR